MSYNLMIPTTSAGTSTPIALGPPGREVGTLSAPGLVTTQKVTIQFSGDGGNTWEDLTVDGTVLEINTANTGVLVTGPGQFRAVKDATTAAVGVYVSTPSSP